MSHRRNALISLSALIWICGCIEPKPHVSVPDKYGCTPPPPEVFTKVGIDAKFAQSTYGKIVQGDITFKTSPEVINLASQAAQDARMRDYIRCLLKHRDSYTDEQIDYFERKSDYMTTKPTPDQLEQWQIKNPFPKNSGKSALNSSERVVYELQDKIEVLRGTYESMQLQPVDSEAWKQASKKVRVEGASLGEQMLLFRDENLNISYQIQKYQYATRAFYMAAESSQNKMKQELSQRAIECADEALKRLNDLKEKAGSGDEVAIRRYQWMLEDNAPNRVKYFRAIAIAINIKGGGNHKAEEVTEMLASISDDYKITYPPEINSVFKGILSPK